MFAAWEDCFYHGIRGNGDNIGSFVAITFPFALDLAVDTVILAGGVSYMSADFGSNDIGVVFSNLYTAHLAEDPFANRALGVVVKGCDTSVFGGVAFPGFPD